MEMDYEWHRRMFVRLIELGHFWNKEISESGALFRSAASDCICFEVDLLVYLYKESFLESIDMLRDYLISVGQLILTNITEVFLWYWYLWISMSLLNNLKAHHLWIVVVIIIKNFLNLRWILHMKPEKKKCLLCKESINLILIQQLRTFIFHVHWE